MNILKVTFIKKDNNSDMGTQNNPNFSVCSMDESEPKSINADKRESKRVIINACSLYESESKIVHKSVNTGKVKNAIKNKG